jgi:ArsR family transcriptional regulator, arsenate/arsenite/antimonite-responsive transcriptional repressor
VQNRADSLHWNFFWYHHFNDSGNKEMITVNAVAALAALAQETRLALFRLLVATGPEGLAAGEIGAQLGIPANTLSFHLKTLSQAGLLVARQEGRFIFYAANYAVMDDLIAFLTQNCCNGVACLPQTEQVATTAKRRSRSTA